MTFFFLKVEMKEGKSDCSAFGMGNQYSTNHQNKICFGKIKMNLALEVAEAKLQLHSSCFYVSIYCNLWQHQLYILKLTQKVLMFDLHFSPSEFDAIYKLVVCLDF